MSSFITSALRRLLPSISLLPSSSHDATQPRPQLLSQAKLDQLNSTMNAHAKEERWLDLLKNDATSHFVLYGVLIYASTALQSTALKDRIIAPKAILSLADLDKPLTGEAKAEWKKFLKRLLRQKNWEELITHPILQVPLPPPRRLRPRLLNGDIQLLAVSRAWNEQYSGDNHRLLLNNINRMSRGKAYSNSVTILQSSGTGKSRMVHEQSNLVFTLPFNLRPYSESKDIAYPPPDIYVTNHLVWRAPNFHAGQTHYLDFLGNLFRTVSDELIKLYKTKQPTYAALARSWRKHLDDDQNRARIYREAMNGPRTDVSSKSQAKQWSLHPPSVRAASDEAKKQLARLLKCINDRCKSLEGFQNGHVKLMLYFDEAHVLTEKTVSGGQNMYNVMCSCFNFFLSSPIFVIYLSTDSSICGLTYPGSLDISRRVPLQAPVTETPFDCSPMFPIKPGKLVLEDLCEVEFMAQFGRPMFWTLLTGAANHKYEILSEIVDLARAKLICQHKISVEHTHLEHHNTALTAVLDVLLNLQFDPRCPAAHNQEADLVAGHMRVAFSVPKGREYLRSGYPSEPLLAEAAVRQMDEFQTLAEVPDTSVMAKILGSVFINGLLDQGQRGEVVFRQLVSEAYRRAVRDDYPDDMPRNFSKGCKLITFIKMLFSGDCAELILNSVPDNVKSSTTFSAGFKDAVVRFTHFGRMADDTGTTTHAMFAAFVRCMAVICCSTQNIVDVLIPVLLMRGETLRESVMTGLLIQIKWRKTKGSAIQYGINQDALGFFPENILADTRPYITLVAEVNRSNPNSQRMTTLETPRKPPVVKVSTVSATPSKLYIPDQPDRMTFPRDVHPRYSIFAYGCSNTVYGVINHSDRPVYKFLLANRDVLDEHHPRKDGNSLRAVRMMKPFWRAGIECYHWIEESFLQKQDWEDEDDGGVVVGKYHDDTIDDTDQSTIL
ncbi:hypothetical protein PILCRDRAFT_828491 [Piloderma croceum F 1598]|uniref:Uncharacterized protein n=1 Tax=Piloderma croceum (strain F 1598) TaxID=765440 RepID=A0A0C3ENP0_PILCF|nr:hypothetical protein PILCRDRAFT_828491 [Piloderma croceum F 1598]